MHQKHRKYCNRRTPVWSAVMTFSREMDHVYC